MNETELRNRLQQLADDAPKGFMAPPQLLRRARRRIAFALTSSIVIGLALVVAGIAGVRALGSADGPRPAEKPSVEPSNDVFGKVQGWIVFRSGSQVVAVDPTESEDSLVVGPSLRADPIGWSPDGTQLLLRSGVSLNRLSFPLDLSVLRADGSRTVLVHSDGGFRSPPFATWGSFSPDGSEVAYACCGSSRGPFVIDARGGDPRELGDPCERNKISGRLVELCGEQLGEAAAWSPDGSRIAWIDFVEDSATYGHHASVLSFVNPDGSGLREEVASLPGEGGQSLVWSPDGSRLAFWADADDLNAQIFVVNADGSGLRQITRGGENRWPAWSPDGTQIAFVRNGTLHIMAADGTDIREIKGAMPDGAIAWNPVA
jgi:Tol biopolymer transport system component